MFPVAVEPGFLSVSSVPSVVYNEGGTMRIVGINGSGRAGGNTSVLVNAILGGAKDAGAETHLIELADFSLRLCKVCKSCKKNHRCILPDDMQKFYDLAPRTDVLVLGSPIYLDHISAHLMTFIQRTYCYVGASLENCWPRKDVRAVLAITYGAGEPNEYDYVLDWVEERLKYYFEIPTVGKFKIPATRHDTVIPATHAEVERARAFGKTLSG